MTLETSATTQPASDAPGWRAALLSDPDLIRGDAELLRLLGLKLAASNVVEFGPVALARLEAERRRESEARFEIQALAESNFAAQAQTHQAVLDLLQARNNADLAFRLDLAARRRFGLGAGLLACEGAAPAGWSALPSGSTDALLGGAEARMGERSGCELLFGDEAAKVGSLALVRLSPHAQGVDRSGSAALPDRD